jgi:hypothetical protein
MHIYHVYLERHDEDSAEQDYEEIEAPSKEAAISQIKKLRVCHDEFTSEPYDCWTVYDCEEIA